MSRWMLFLYAKFFDGVYKYIDGMYLHKLKKSRIFAIAKAKTNDYNNLLNN